MADPSHIIQAEYGVPIDGLLHIGSHSGGVFDSYVSHGVGRVAYVEPSPESYSALKKRISGYPGHAAVNALCLDVSGLELDFNIASNPMFSSVLSPSGKLLETGVSITQRLRMTTTTVDHIVSSFGQRFNVINLTVPGLELRILAGARKSLSAVEFVYITLDQRSNFENEDSLESLNWYLKGFGFRLLQFRTSLTGHGELLYSNRVKARVG